jgi:1-acyl-sn-glycerol-3-phosphate acyltransferase
VDPIIILGQVDAWPVAKAEVADWPVLGHGAQMAGILYVRREDSRNRAMILSKIGSTIEKGFTVILFPEGTTSDLDGTLPFRKGGFLMAAKNGVPVVPFALCFQDPDDYWVRDESFLTHAARRFRQKNINIKVIYGLPITHDDPDYLMDTARAWINDQLHREVPASGLPA